MHDSQDEKGIAHFRVKHAIMGIASLRICGNRLPSLAMPWAKNSPLYGVVNFRSEVKPKARLYSLVVIHRLTKFRLGFRVERIAHSGNLFRMASNTC